MTRPFEDECLDEGWFLDQPYADKPESELTDEETVEIILYYKRKSAIILKSAGIRPHLS